MGAHNRKPVLHPRSRSASSARAIAEKLGEAHAANQAQDFHLRNTTPERDSLEEDIRGLREFGVPAEYRRQMMRRLALVISENHREYGFVGAAAGHAVSLTRAAETVKSTFDLLREPLAVLIRPGDYGPEEFANANRRVRDIAAVADPEILLSWSLFHELKTPKYAALLSAMGFGAPMRTACMTPGCELHGVPEIELTCPGCGETRDEVQPVRLGTPSGSGVRDADRSVS